MKKVNKKTIKVCAIIGLIVMMISMFSGCASIERGFKSFSSDMTGGLDRTVIVYTLTGEELQRFEGKIDLEITDGGKVLFDLDGKRYIFYNCTVEVIEN